jgi:hypothetical protein
MHHGVDQLWATILFAGPMLYFVWPLLLGGRATPVRHPAGPGALDTNPTLPRARHTPGYVSSGAS